MGGYIPIFTQLADEIFLHHENTQNSPFLLGNIRFPGGYETTAVLVQPHQAIGPPFMFTALPEAGEHAPIGKDLLFFFLIFYPNTACETGVSL